MGTLVFIFILALAIILITFVFPVLGSRRAIPHVIQRFREYGAVGKANARHLEEIIPRPGKMGILKRMYSPRDYRLPALLTLVKQNIVQKTNDGRLYLSEKELKASKWKNY